MWDWFARRGLSIRQGARVDTPVAPRLTGMVTGKYKLLYAYLENRYADVVVLTFGQIEDILGFTLPDPARTHQEWWTTAGTPSEKPPFSDAWRLAGRTAVPNLLARTVVFERSQESKPGLH
jgi:hypothetical protein